MSEWKLAVRHETPVFARHLITLGMIEDVEGRLGFEYDHFKYVRGNVYLHTPTNERFSSFLQTRAQKDPEFYKDIVEDTRQQGSSLEVISKWIGTSKLSGKSDRRLSYLLVRYAEEFKGMSPYLLAPVVLDKILSEIIEDELEVRLGERKDSTNFKKIFSALTASSKETQTAKAQKLLLEIAADVHRDDKLNSMFQHYPSTEVLKKLEERDTPVLRKIELFLRKYSWLPFEYGYGVASSRQDVIDRIKENIGGEDPKKRLERIKTNEANLQEESKTAIRDLKFAPQVRRAIKLMKEYVFLRSSRLEYYARAGLYVRPLFEEICRRKALDYYDLLTLTCQEIVAMVEAKTNPDKNLIAERKSGYAIELNGRQPTIYTGNEIQKVAEQESADRSIRIAHGSIANKGYAKGPAKVVLGETDFDKVSRGDIVVVVISTPKFNPVLEKAAAIIADIGGMTSHTAIISRELGIPCVIGTEIATRVFKDCDILEVDADNGTVKRIS